jgi:glucose/arabinose dehydrogenase
MPAMRALVAIPLVLAACGSKSSTPPHIDAAPAPFCAPKHGSKLKLTKIASGLTEPIYVTAPAGDKRLFLVERPGRIRLIGADGVLRDTPYLDITSEITENGEGGLLGLAFHGDFAHDPKLYVFYTRKADGFEVIDEYTVDPAAETVTSQPRNLIVQTDPASNHNGGTLQWGPDNYLYFGIGDGGGGGDQYMNGQNPQTMMAKISRIDPDHPANGKPYGIPADNPWADGKSGVPEMYLWGLRNPFRFSVDDDGTVYIGDVGQASFEEIDVVPPAQKGENLGWSIFEGNSCFRDAATCQAAAGLTPPLFDYDRRSSGQCAVIGGFVYHGACMPDLAGQYVYGDWCSGEVDTFTYAGGQAMGRTNHTEIDPDQQLKGNLGSFGKDGFGELYACALSHGDVYRIEVE